MPVPYPNQDISAKDDNSNYSIGYKDKDGKFRAVSDSDGLPIKGSVSENNVPTITQTSVVTDIVDIVTQWAGDIVTIEGDTNGQRYIKISQSPFNADTETVITSKETYKMPFVIDSALSISNRLVGVDTAFGIVWVDDTGAIEYIAPRANVAISGNITVATNVWTINTPVPHGFVPGDRIVLTGNTDSRLNVWPVLITAIITATQFTITSTLANATYTAGGSIHVAWPIDGAANATNLIFDNATATNAFSTARRAGNSKFQSIAITVGSTAIWNVPGVRTQSFIPTTRYRLQAYPDFTYFETLPINNTASPQWVFKNETVIPDSNKAYKVKYSTRNNENLSVPIAKITNISKAGGITATVTTDVPHWLTATVDFVQIQWVFNFADFPNHTVPTAVVAVISPTQFTIFMGATTPTTNTTGGVVWKINGNCTIPNQTSTRTIVNVLASGNELDLTLSASGSWMVLAGDTISVYGLSPWLSAYEWAYLVLDATSTSTHVICKPINNDWSTRTIADLVSTASGGMPIKRVDYIIYWTRTKEVPRQSVEITGSDANSDVSRSQKSFIINSSIPASSTQAGGSGTNIWQVGWYSGLLVVDVTSAALTTTTTTAAIQPGLIAWVGAYANQFNVVVTAVTGTTPTLDISIEESMDSGTNWQAIYHFPRIIANGIYPTPLIKSFGTRFRYVQTVAGITPSFTRAINRVMYTVNAPIIRNFIDRSIVLTTLNSTSPIFNIDGTDKVQFSIAVGAITTTAPQIQLEVSDDGVNFALIGTPVTAVASSTVRSAALSDMGKFARVRVTTAGVGVTANFINIKAIWL